MTTLALADHGWLRNPGFDGLFIFGVATLAIAGGLFVQANPHLFLAVFMANVWLLGYHHVVATFTRLTFDSESFREHRKMVLVLPILVAGAVAVVSLTIGLWAITTLYLHWQWYHYTRQSEGISKAFAGKSRDRYTGHPMLTRLVFWLVPITGIATVSARDPGSFLGMQLVVLPVPMLAAKLLYATSAVLLLAWLVQHLRAARRGQMAVPYFLYMTSHFTIYMVAYVIIKEINFGWLVINIWHNAQYILFVWLYNNRRFGGAIHAEHKFLSAISKTSRFWLYFTVCLAISTAVYLFILYFAVPWTIRTSPLEPLVVVALFYQTINFHHYIVDSRIWKLRKKPIRSNLGIAT